MSPECSTPDGRHLLERCTCELTACRRWYCVWCEAIIDRSRTATAEGVSS